MCASNSPPGGLAPADTPQFILLTHDDAVNGKKKLIFQPSFVLNFFVNCPPPFSTDNFLFPKFNYSTVLNKLFLYSDLLQLYPTR
jgi:hypothetical protein